MVSGLPMVWSLITTKKGRNAKAEVNYNGYVGNQIVTNQVKMASGTQYASNG
jgi:hypothetical protein